MGIKKQCKIFKVNLNFEDEAKDTENLNSFLRANDVISVSSQFVLAGADYYMVFVVYLAKEAVLEAKGAGTKKALSLQGWTRLWLQSLRSGGATRLLNESGRLTWC